MIETGLSPAVGVRLQATGFSQKETEKEAARKRARKSPATSLIWALAEACGLKPVAFFGRESCSLI